MKRLNFLVIRDNTNSQESKISHHINGEGMDLWFIFKSTANTHMKINSNQSNER